MSNTVIKECIAVIVRSHELDSDYFIYLYDDTHKITIVKKKHYKYFPQGKKNPYCRFIKRRIHMDYN